jgi:threonine aldolase
MNNSQHARSRKISFTSDNIAGVSSEILESIVTHSSGNALPYGNDVLSQKLEQKMSAIFEKEVSVFLVPTGTAANSLCLASLAPSWGAVLCHPESHINNDECSAPEFFSNGVKLISIDGQDCKIDADRLKIRAAQKIGDVHTVQPSVVSVTQSTEIGSVYTLNELQNIGEICKAHNLRYHMDGARFANAVAALNCSPADMTWKVGLDALSFGATKNGALGVEAIVLFDKSLSSEFAYRRKRSGHLMSKMRFMSAQIDAYLRNNLWLNNAKHANNMADRLRTGLGGIDNIELINPSKTNIVFCRMPTSLSEKLLSQGFEFYNNRWEEGVVRLVTSFATTPEEVECFIEAASSI